MRKRFYFLGAFLSIVAGFFVGAYFAEMTLRETMRFVGISAGVFGAIVLFSFFMSKALHED